MPIPQIPDHYLAQVVMRPDTMPASNTFVNTFFFKDDVGGRSHSAVADDVETLLERFYNTVIAPSPARIASFLSSVIDPTLTEVRVYDLGDATPRIPEIRGMGSWLIGADALPNECAVVCSYRGGLVPSPTGGTNEKRERGRIYIGPLNKASAELTAGDQDARVHTNLISAIAACADDMRDQVAVDVTWMQYSRVANVMRAVLQGFVNNRFDTQRRRGADESTRTVW